jgi:hypothetical protein
LLLALLKKDPSERLGSWNNPPSDIMAHSFFHDINWETVLQRNRDGPWVPEPIIFGRKHRSESQTAKAPIISTATEPGSTTNISHGEAQVAANVAENPGANLTASTKPGLRPKSVDLNKAPSSDNNGDSERDSLAGRPTEMMQLRDSIIAFSKGQQANRIQDWSFFDESILISASDQTTTRTASNTETSDTAMQSGKEITDTGSNPL